MVDVLDTFLMDPLYQRGKRDSGLSGPYYFDVADFAFLYITVHFGQHYFPAFRCLFEKNSYQITYSSLGIWFAYCDRLGNCGRG